MVGDNDWETWGTAAGRVRQPQGAGEPRATMIFHCGLDGPGGNGVPSSGSG